MSAYLTYALLNNELIHISDKRVKNGYKSGCICPECGNKLNARNNGKIRDKHFAHIFETNHKCGYESALHMLVKEIIYKSKKIYLPDYYIKTNDFFFSERLIKKGGIFYFDKVEKEVFQTENKNSIKVDLVGYYKEQKLYIEIANTHFVDDDKLNKIKKLETACLEINISNTELNEEKIIEFLTTEQKDIYWLSNPNVENKYHQRIENIKKQKEEKELKREFEFKKKYEYYKNEKFRIVNENDNTINYCPFLVNSIRRKLDPKEENFKVIQNIMNGARWDGEVHGDIIYGKYIVVNNKKTWIFPPNDTMNKWDENQVQIKKDLESALKLIKWYKEKSSIGKCSKCRFLVEKISNQSKKLSICSYTSL